MTVNTRILKAQFEYLAPDALQEAGQLLNQYGADAKVIAGGTDLLVQMKKEVISPRYLIDIMKIADLSFIKTENGWLRIGAATKWSEFVEFCSKDPKYVALYEASRSVGKVQVRNMGTIGGNLCQRPRCWYYRNKNIVCLKKGGAQCYAFTGENKYSNCMITDTSL